ncbi:MAG: peptide deformylase [Patescibacteria group bacterium]|nr:peptide deformylase [Patescibacteria group bacterium]
MRFKIETGDANPILRAVSPDIRPEVFRKYAPLAEAMVKYVKNPDNRCVGVAAPQVGQNVRLIAVSLLSSYDDETYRTVAMFNPTVLEKSDMLESDSEGCLSVPGMRGDVMRPKRVKLRYFDAKGAAFVREMEGLMARVVQHEIDHLDGVLFTDKTVGEAVFDTEEAL